MKWDFKFIVASLNLTNSLKGLCYFNPESNRTVWVGRGRVPGFLAGRCSLVRHGFTSGPVILDWPYDPQQRPEPRPTHSGRKGDGRRRRAPWPPESYLHVEAVQGWVELLLAGQTVPLTTAEHTGEEAEQQQVPEQDFHVAGAGSQRLKHIHKDAWQ